MHLNFSCFGTLHDSARLFLPCFFYFVSFLFSPPWLFRSTKISSLFSDQFQVAVFYLSVLFSDFYFILFNCAPFRVKTFLMKNKDVYNFWWTEQMDRNLILTGCGFKLYRFQSSGQLSLIEETNERDWHCCESTNEIALVGFDF